MFRFILIILYFQFDRVISLNKEFDSFQKNLQLPWDCRKALTTTKLQSEGLGRVTCSGKKGLGLYIYNECTHLII